MKKTTLADNLPECSAAAAGFGDFFSGLLETTAAKTIDDALGQQIRAYVPVSYTHLTLPTKA